MSNAMHAADGSPEPELPNMIPDDADQPPRPSTTPRPGPPPEQGVNELRSEIGLWKARARQNLAELKLARMEAEADRRRVDELLDKLRDTRSEARKWRQKYQAEGAS